MDRPFAGRDDRVEHSARSSRRDEGLVEARLRSGAWIVLTASAVFVLVDVVLARDALASLLLLKALQSAIVIVMLLALPRLHDADVLRWVGAATVSGIYFTTAASGAVRDEMVTATFLVLVTVMGTATFVPWGGRAQLVTAVAAMLALAVARIGMPEALGREAVYRWLASGVALFGSVWIAHEHERQRRDRRRAERELATESRVSAALARVGEEMMRCESTPVILDRLCGLVAELLRCDQTALVLYDTGDNAYVPHSSFGYREADVETLRSLRVPARTLKPLLVMLHSSGAVQIETETIEDSAMRELHQRHHVANSLYVPLRRAGEIIGIISAHYREARRRFGRAQERIAIGVAHLASMALQNTRLLEELREANRIKSDFVSTMSHELRTPVSVILGYAEMLAEDLDRRDRAVLLERIRRSGLELRDMVDATLSLSRLEAGQDPPCLELVQLPALFAELIDEFEAMVPLDDVVLRWEGPEHLEMETDRRKLRTILKNLLGNALKFTRRGEVVLECRRDGDRVRLVVRDTGIGIAPRHLPIIFDMFRQADSSDARTYSGAGLGLYIVQRLLNQLGGEIAVASEVGRGSRFTIMLPAGTNAPSYRSQPSAGPPH